MIKWTTLGILFILPFFKHGFCQVSGKVSDSRTGKPLDGVEVFIDRGKDFSNTTEEGQFELRDIATGFVTLVLYRNGYELYHSSMRVQDGRAYTLNLTLTPEKKRESGSVRQSFQDDIQTGYRIVSYENPQVSKRKFTRFELLASTDLQQQVDWERIRNQLYRGSLRHFLASLVHGTCKSEGFEIRRDGKEVSPESLITTTSLEDYYRLVLGDPVEVIYNNQTNILVGRGALDVSNTGLLLNEDLLEVTGTMRNFRLPISYVPFAGDVDLAFEEMIKRYYEKVYVHTDKPYYYQGEPMWFKVYVNYYDLSMRDSLSRVLYVELISPEKEIVLEKMLKIDSGMAQGDFILPDTIKRGDYFLRAYTNLQRNFGDENLYAKHIPVLGITDKVDPTQGNWTPVKSDWVTIRTDKERYNTRDKIEMTIEVRDETGNPIDANLSVSVTDASQVVPIQAIDIVDSYRINNQIVIPNSLNYSVERGITLAGIVNVNDGKSNQASVTFVEWQSDNVAMVNTNEMGDFVISGFDFYDSAQFFYTVDTNTKVGGQVHFNERSRARIKNIQPETMHLALVKTDFPQRIFSEFEVPREARLLDAVEIKSTKIQDVDREERPFGKPDFVLTAKDMNYSSGNLINTIIGKVPGMRAYEYVDARGRASWKLGFSRSIGLTSNNSTEPLVLINDVPMAGNAGEIIADLDPYTVESIEFTRRINVLYGAQGINGVISIRTKTGPNLKPTPVKTANNVVLAGYCRPRVFESLQYSEGQKFQGADYRALVYWSPLLSVDGESKTISFYAADLETVYRVELAGVTEKNEPIYASYFVKIEND